MNKFTKMALVCTAAVAVAFSYTATANPAGKEIPTQAVDSKVSQDNITLAVSGMR
jgi:hypothetical protein